MINYSVSARKKDVKQSIYDYLNIKFNNLDKNKVSTVFGFVEQSSLYGGRIFNGAELSRNDVKYLYKMGIGLKLPLTNHYVTDSEYKDNLEFLDKYHKSGNSVAVVNDDLANWIKRDFPKYEIEASVIKNIHTQSTIDKYLDLYDIIVLPMDMYSDLDYLAGLQHKKRLRFFVQAACAYNCPAKVCYKTISRINKSPDGEGEELFKCSQEIKPRDFKGFQEFDMELLIRLGFTNFKIIRNVFYKTNSPALVLK